MNCEEFVVEELKRAGKHVEELKYRLEKIKDSYDYIYKDLTTLLGLLECKTDSKGDKYYYLSEWESLGQNYKTINNIYKKYIPIEECCCESEKE